MGRKKSQNQNLLINDLEIDENLLTDDESRPAVKQAASLRSRPGKKKKKQSANKVMNDANLINISDFESASSTLSDPDELADRLDRSDASKPDSACDSNEFNLLGEFLNQERDDGSDLTNDFKRNLDLNLKKKKRTFLSSDRTDFLNFILSEQQKIKKNSSFNSFLNSSKCNADAFKLNSLTASRANRREAAGERPSRHIDHQAYSDDEDANSEFNLLLNHERASSDTTAGELADDEDDGLNYLDYLNHNSTKRRFRRLFASLFAFLRFDRTPARPNNLNSYLLSRLNQRPHTAEAAADSNRLRPSTNELRPSEPLSEDELDDLDFETSFSAAHSPTSLLGKLRASILNLTHYLNPLTKRQSNKSNYFDNHKLSAAECVDLLGATAASSTKDDELFGEDGWFDHHGKLQQNKQVNVRLLKSKSHVQPESMFYIMVQVFIPFLIAGFGTVGAGLVLDHVQVLERRWLISTVLLIY